MNRSAQRKDRRRTPVKIDVPIDPPPPHVASITRDTVLLEWEPVRQHVCLVKLQAIDVTRKSAKAPWKHFNPRKGVGIESVIENGADILSSGVITGLSPNTHYIFRLMVSNMAGAACGEATHIHTTEKPEPTKKLKKRRGLFSVLTAFMPRRAKKGKKAKKQSEVLYAAPTIEEERAAESGRLKMALCSWDLARDDDKEVHERTSSSSSRKNRASKDLHAPALAHEPSPSRNGRHENESTKQSAQVHVSRHSRGVHNGGKGKHAPHDGSNAKARAPPVPSRKEEHRIQQQQREGNDSHPTLQDATSTAKRSVSLLEAIKINEGSKANHSVVPTPSSSESSDSVRGRYDDPATSGDEEPVQYDFASPDDADQDRGHGQPSSKKEQAMEVYDNVHTDFSGLTTPNGSESAPDDVKPTTASPLRHTEKRAAMIKAPARDDDSLSATSGLTQVLQEVEQENKRPALEQGLTKAISSRLTAPTTAPVTGQSKLAQIEKRRKEASQMFAGMGKHAKAAAPARSKIFQALNPQPLWYVSRREKERQQEEAEESDGDDVDEDGDFNAVERGPICPRGGARDIGGANYARRYCDDGQVELIENDTLHSGDDETDDECASSTDSESSSLAADLGEFQVQLDAMRRKHEEENRLRAEELKKKHEEDKRVHDQQLQQELQAIGEREKRERKKEEVSTADVEKAQNRVGQLFKSDCKFSFF